MSDTTKDTNKNQLAEFQKKILRSQLESATPTGQANQFEGLKILLDDGVSLLNNLTKQIEKSIYELNQSDNQSFKKFSTLTAQITELKNQIQQTTDSINKIKTYLDNPSASKTESEIKTESPPLAKVGYSTPLSFSHGSQQAAARQKAIAASLIQEPSATDSNQKGKG
jgi:septal ring factor EnvC (AmiA/AmiB activator)